MSECHVAGCHWTVAATCHGVGPTCHVIADVAATSLLTWQVNELTLTVDWSTGRVWIGSSRVATYHHLSGATWHLRYISQPEAFMSLFGQDAETFTTMMFLNVDQLEKQLDKNEFQLEDGSMAAFWVLNSLPMCTRKRLIDLVLGGNPRVEFSELLVLGGFLQESHSTLARAGLTANPHMVPIQISLTLMNANKLLIQVQ
ncbi:hypothetical protein Tco_0721366, partial [Tanacetum coccineum]